MSSSLNDGRAALGGWVRSIRKQQGRTLGDLGAATGLSKPTLSKIENGRVAVSYDTLIKLANGLAVDLSALFASTDAAPTAQGNGRRSVTRKGEGKIYETRQYRYEMLCADLAPKKLFPILATLRARARATPVELTGHAGEEFAFVLKGTVEVRSEFYGPLRLKAGDSLYFDSAMKHALLSAGKGEARILWIATSTPLSPRFV